MTKRSTSYLLVLAALLLPAAPPASAAAQPAEPRVLVLGFDGVDAELTEQWMAEGHLPNLARLREQGSYAPLRSTVPSQTPVSWSTFSTGLHPGRHAIFDFLKRDLETYRPSFAAFDETTVPFLAGKWNPALFAAVGLLLGVVLGFLAAWLLRMQGRSRRAVAAVAGLVAALGLGWVARELVPTSRPLAINRQQGDTFWEVLGEAGKRVRVMRMPVTFPPEPYPHGELLAGLGTPDLSFRIGKPFYFTSELFFQPKGHGDFSIETVELVDNKGVIPTEIQGPPNKLFPERSAYVKIPMQLAVAEDRSRLEIEVSGARLSLAPGEWSDWVRFTFPFNSLVKIQGIGRFRLLGLDPEVRLYLSPIQFDPERLPPILSLTTPRSFADDLTSRFGLFKTIGWMIDTWSMTDGTIDEEVFFEDVAATVAKDEEMLVGLLADDEWDVYFHYFEFTDRVQHVMWRHTDPLHPLYTEEGHARWGDSIRKSYEQMDRIVGHVMETMPPETFLMVVSDHGFASWRRVMNYNTWLAREGYLVLKGESPERANLEDLFDQGEFFVNVDWSRTRAYAMGLGNIYVNLAGRESQGIVQPGAEYEALTAEIRQKLEAFQDPENGEHPVAHVWTRDEAYGVYDPNLIPDLFPSNNEGYRVGWQDTLGIVAKEIVETNRDIWSGDHCSLHPPLVDGVLFANRPLDLDPQPYMGDVMPTLLALYGVAEPVRLDGRSLLP
ncbi:MAG: alkaline phosphatase family protein [Thermoanaerobaculia bacterium]|nr:alkaline phosphatase family protein [Thermoanaerobaculia bacterium]